uniref:endochitinase A-like n=1 Tax=Erigeron canadensis TaxID=72917 RepID=UPI001CB99D14|nr:endochitinase A-like [Erigeron canadensis]
MNRKDSFAGAGARNHLGMTTGILPHRRGMPFSKTNNNTVENYNHNSNSDLFNRNRNSFPAASSDESDLQVRLARLSVGSAKPAKSILDDMLASNEGGKNDYDWLLTPPGTPLVPSTDGKESRPTPVTARSRSSVRASSINKTSRLSVSQSESNYSSRPARSSSVTRPSISTNQYATYSSRNTNILNTSSASVSSYIRPSTPTRSSTTARPSTPSTRTTPSRGSTPSRTRPSPTTTSNDRTTKTSQTTRPSTPGSRPQTPGSLNTPTIRPSSRPSTPTRRSVTPSLSPSTTSATSAGRGLSSNARSTGSTSRPSSPSPRLRPPPQPINHADFSHETPPNLRTTLPDRPLSAGRSRPGGSTTVKGNIEPSNTGSITRRHSSPIVNRGRIAETPGRGRPHANGHVVETLEPRRSSHLPDSLARKTIKSSNSDNGAGFGRNISKKSLDMAIKHMDIRNGGARPLSGSTLFPQSIRSSNSRTQPGRASSVPGSVDGSISNGVGSENGNYINGYSWNRGLPTEDHSPHSSKLSSEVDIYESSRYDAILLKEDLKNTSWLHGADDKIDEGSFFDNGFESLPEPFGPL